MLQIRLLRFRRIRFGKLRGVLFSLCSELVSRPWAREWLVALVVRKNGRFGELSTSRRSAWTRTCRSTFRVKLVNVSIAREDDWYVDVFDVLEAVVWTIHASFGSEHPEILLLTEVFVVGCGW